MTTQPDKTISQILEELIIECAPSLVQGTELTDEGWILRDKIISALERQKREIDREWEKKIEGFDIISENYKDDTPTRSLNQRIFLERRYKAYKIYLEGVNSDNYKESLEIISILMDKKSEKDLWLLDKLADEIVKYESKKFPSEKE